MTSISSKTDLETWATASDGTVGTITADFNVSGGAIQITNNGGVLAGAGYTITFTGGKLTPLFTVAASTTTTIQQFKVVTDGTFSDGIIVGTINAANVTVGVDNCAVVSAGGTLEIDGTSGAIVSQIANVSGYTVNITGCYTTAAIIGNGAGGIIGRSISTSAGAVAIKLCYTTGAISAGAGGIAGDAFGRASTNSANALIDSCYSTGAIAATGSGIVADVVGFSSGNVLIDNCYSSGSMDNLAHGIAGSISGTVDITNCVAINAGSTGTGAPRPFYDSGSPTITRCLAGSIAISQDGSSVNGLKEEGGADPADTWDTSGSFSSAYGLNRFNNTPWDTAEYTQSTDPAEFLAGGGGGGDPHITTMDNKKYDLITKGVFNMFDNNIKGARLVVNADVFVPDHPIWSDKEYINNVLISYKGKKIMASPGFRGRKAQIISMDEEFENDDSITITERDERMKDNHKMFCGECKYRNRDYSLFRRHRRNSTHNLLKSVRNSITISITDEHNVYNIKLTNVNSDNFDPAHVSFKIHDRSAYKSYTGCVSQLHENYGCDVESLEYIREIE